MHAQAVDTRPTSLSEVCPGIEARLLTDSGSYILHAALQEPYFSKSKTPGFFAVIPLSTVHACISYVVRPHLTSPLAAALHTKSVHNYIHRLTAVYLHAHFSYKAMRR